jgi:hypothetical protein
MWRRPTKTLRNGPTERRSRSSVVTARTVMKVVTNDVKRLNSAFSRAETSL